VEARREGVASMSAISVAFWLAMIQYLL